jgi:hypothetical protein
MGRRKSGATFTIRRDGIGAVATSALPAPARRVLTWLHETREDAAVTDTSGQFKKAPRRKKEPAKSVRVSPEMRKAYEDEIKARAERESSYLQHLQIRDPK